MELLSVANVPFSVVLTKADALKVPNIEVGRPAGCGGGFEVSEPSHAGGGDASG